MMQILPPDAHTGMVSLTTPFRPESPGSQRPTTAVHLNGFNLGEDIVISFESVAGGGIQTSFHQPTIGPAFVTLKPFGLGASRWFSIETIVDVGKLKFVDQVIPVFNAAAPRSTTLFALLRLVMPDGRTVDTSSTQIVVSKTRRAFALPIVIDDMPPNALQDAVSARLIFFVEARNVPLDIYAISIMGVMAQEPIRGMPRSQMEEHAKDPDSRVRKARFHTTDLEWQELRWNSSVGNENCRIDIDSVANQHVAIFSRDDAMVVDLSTAADSRWRTLELRMPELENTGDLALHLRLGLTAPDLTREDPVNLVLRVYDGEWATWSDTELQVQIHDGMRHEDHEPVVNLSHLLPDVRKMHNIGILCFFPARCKAFDLRCFEITSFDRRL